MLGELIARRSFVPQGVSAQAASRLQCCWMAKYVLWKAWKAKGWEIAFEGEGDDDCLCSGMMRADNYWVFQ